VKCEPAPGKADSIALLALVQVGGLRFFCLFCTFRFLLGVRVAVILSSEQEWVLHLQYSCSSATSSAGLWVSSCVQR